MTTRYILEYRSEFGHIWRRVAFDTLEEAMALRHSLAPEIPTQLVREEPAPASAEPVAPLCNRFMGTGVHGSDKGEDHYCVRRKGHAGHHSTLPHRDDAAPPAPEPVADAAAVALRDAAKELCASEDAEPRCYDSGGEMTVAWSKWSEANAAAWNKLRAALASLPAETKEPK